MTEHEISIKSINIKPKSNIFAFHLQIITLIDMFPDVSGPSLVLEYMPYTLYSKLKDENRPLIRREIKSYMRMLLKGLKFLHELNIMHRVR